MKTLFVSSAAALVLMAMATEAQASPCVQVQINSGSLNLHYDPFSPGTLQQTFTLRVRRTSPNIRAANIVLVDTDSTGSNHQLGHRGPRGYTITQAEGNLRAVLVSGAEQPNRTNGVAINFANGAQNDVETVNLTFTLPAGRDVRAGQFTEDLEARFFCVLANRDITPIESQTNNGLRLDLTVPEKISTYIGSAGTRRGQINLGTLDTRSPTVRPLAITAQTTVAYDMQMEKSRGQLRRRDDDSYGIPYAMTLDNRPVSDGSVMQCPRTPVPAGRTHTLQVAVQPQDVRAVPAGNYSDVVTLTFVPRSGLARSRTCALSNQGA